MYYHELWSKADMLYFQPSGWGRWEEELLTSSLSVCICGLVPGGQRCWPWGWPLLWTLEKRKVESWWQEASAGEHCGNGSGPGRQEEQPGAGEEAGGGGKGFCRLILPKIWWITYLAHWDWNDVTALCSFFLVFLSRVEYWRHEWHIYSILCYFTLLSVTSFIVLISALLPILSFSA